MTTETDPFTALFRGHDIAVPIIERAVRKIWPFRQMARLGRWNRRGRPVPTTEDIALAISRAAGVAVKRIEPVVCEPRETLAYGQTLTFDNSLTIRLWNNNWMSLRRAFRDSGRDEEQVELDLKRLVRQEIGEPLGFRFVDNLSYVPRGAAQESLLASLYWYLAFSFAGDLQKMADHEPLIGILSAAVPLGLLTEGDRHWRVAELPKL